MSLAPPAPTPSKPGARLPTASSAAFQLLVTVLVRVKNCTPALPYLHARCRANRDDMLWQVDVNPHRCIVQAKCRAQRGRHKHQSLCMLHSAHIGRSPLKEPLQPVKEKKGSGTGMGTLMPTMPTSISFWNLRAAAPACNDAASQRKESMLVTAGWQQVKH